MSGTPFPLGKGAGGLGWSGLESHVVVERELVRMRAQRDLLELLGGLVVDIGLDQILAEDPALEQELVVRLKRREALLQAAGRLRDALALLGLHLVEILVDRRRRHDLV